MSELASLVWMPEQVRQLDRAAIQGGIPGYTLMARAGQCAFDAARGRWPAARRWLVLCGAGNNAGDGFVIARLARTTGCSVTVAALSDPQRLAGDAARAWRDYQAAGGTVVQFTAGLLDKPDLVVDALLGTGLDRPLEGAWLHAVESLNESGRPVLAVDIPTGLDGRTGAVLGAAVRADLTVTFIGFKLGFFVGRGRDLTGDLVLEDLNVPPEIASAATPVLRVFGPPDLARVLAPRRATAHKGAFGHVLVVGGTVGMSGAVRLAGEAALRSGAGLVTVATKPANAPFVTGFRPELMSVGIDSPDALDALLERATVVALGTGLGRDEWAQAVFARVVGADRPLVVDADGLNLLAEQPCRRDDWILTPHPGEAGRLLGCSAGAVQADRLAALRELAARYAGTVVLKGACTLVGRDGELPFVINRGNAGMATAGMGDVLTGVIAGLTAQTRSTEPLTAAAAACVHACAGDDAAAGGERGLLASDLFPHLRPWLNPAA